MNWGENGAVSGRHEPLAPRDVPDGGDGGDGGDIVMMCDQGLTTLRGLPERRSVCEVFEPKVRTVNQVDAA